jgi:hypothetical protein
MAKFQFLSFFIVFPVFITCHIIEASELDSVNAIPFCKPFRLDQVVQAAPIREELIEKAHSDKDWDKDPGKIKGLKPKFVGHNKVVFKILSKSQKLKNLLAECPNKVRFLAVEKVRVFPLKELALPPSLLKLGKPTDQVPSDAMIFVGP